MRTAIRVCALGAWLTACGGGDRWDVLDLVDTYGDLAARASWPGFDGRTVPLAIWDGERTWLFRHPDPPSEFRRHEGRADVWIAAGRHPVATANTSAELGGFRTAVLLADSTAGGRARLRELAGMLVHEAFHVHQALHHPGWAPNEVELFTYPIEDPEGLRRRRMETAALRRALRSEAPDSVRRLCWARGWLRIRRARMARLPEGAAAYERGAELSEGLARYVEASALGRRAPPALPPEGYAPEAVRSRAYDVGHALAWLLDRVGPDWKGRLTTGAGTLEEALEEALATSRGSTCRLTPDESGRALAVARADLERLARRRAERLSGFEEAPGWRVEIVAPEGAPLFPAAFDPQNVDRLGEGTVLHGRWLRLEGRGGSVEVLDREALTDAAGPHPLFTGVRRLLVTGLSGEPEVDEASGLLRIRAEGLTADLTGATLTRSGRRWRVELGASGER